MHRSRWPIAIRGLLRGATSFVVLAVAPQVQASEQVASLNQDTVYEIPAQPLDTALAAFGRQGVFQILYDARLASTRQSRGVSGRLTATSAIDRLLSGTGLEARFTGRRSITIALSSPVSAENRTDVGRESGSDMMLGPLRVDAPRRIGRPLDFSSYAQVVASDLRQHLARTRGLNAETYEVELLVWLDVDGRMSRVELFDMVSKSQVNTAVQASLKDAVISRPPPQNLPQPLRLRIWSRNEQID